VTSSTSRTPVAADEAFPSLASMRDAHGRLLQRRRESGDTPGFLAEVDSFIRRGQAAGVLLDVDEARSASQSLLDYWANALYRAGSSPPDATLAEFDAALAPELDDTLCPYLGLDAFRPEKHELFFGRQRLVEHLLGQLKDNRLLAVVGPSGSGKSSLVLAGLWPRLKAGGLPGSQNWRYYPPMVPGSNPLRSLARLTQPPGAGTAEWAQRQVEGFQRDPGHLLQLIGERGDVPAVLVVDQFEEVFTLCNDDQVRQAFIDNLLRLVQAPGARHTAILTMRSDFESHVTRLPALQPLFERAQTRVTPMSAGELREAIEKPAERVGLKFREEVVNALLADVLGEPAALPLLQFTLLKLWADRQRNRITWDIYHRTGGGRMALARSADALYEKSLIPEEQVTARRILLRLVRPGEGLEVTSNRIQRETLYRSGEARDRIDRVLDKLIRARLVRLTEGDTPADAQIEVAHEALVRNWPRLVDWLGEERETLRRRLRLTASAEQWKALNKNSGALLRGLPLEEALRYQDLNELETEFVQSSISHEQKKRLSVRVVVATVFVLLATVVAIAGYQWRIAESERAKAEVERANVETEKAKHEAWRTNQERLDEVNKAIAAQEQMRAAEKAREEAVALRKKAELQASLASSRELGAASISSLSVDVELSNMLALYAISEYATDEARNALQRHVQALWGRRMLLSLHGHTGYIEGVAFSPDRRRLATASHDWTAKVWDLISGNELLTLRGHAGRVNGIAFSPDGRRLATASSDRTTRVWDVSSGKELLTLSHAGQVLAVTFSPDGKLVATASSDDSAGLWDSTSGKMIRRLTGHTDNVNNVAFSPNGERIATVSDDRTATVWDVATGKELLTLRGHTEKVHGIAFSPDGKSLATASSDKTARVWDASSGKESHRLAHALRSNGVAFSPDGKRLATASDDKTAKVWDLRTGEAVFTLSDHSEIVNGVAFDPDGSRLATASYDRTTKVWDVVDRHTDKIIGVVYSSDGSRLATASYDQTAKVWDAASGRELLTLRGHTDTVYGVAFSPNGRHLATASFDDTAKVWDALFGRELVTLRGHAGDVNNAAFSENGERIATVSDDRTAKIWDAASGKELRTLRGHAGIVIGLAFSRDGNRLATASFDRTAKVWDVASGKELLTLRGHDSNVWSVAFSPDGKRLATASADRTTGAAKVWDLSSGRELLTIRTGAVYGVAYSPDGTRLATAGPDRTAKVWDAASGRELLTLRAHTDTVYGVAFSPDGSRIATTSGDKTVRIHSLDLRDAVALARSRVTRALTEEECEKYLHKKCDDALALVALGNRLARAGKLESAVPSFRKALGLHKLPPSLTFDAETEARRIAQEERRSTARRLVIEGSNLARAVDVGAAVSSFQMALELDSSMRFDSEMEARRLAAQALVASGRFLAARGDIAGGAARFRDAAKLDTTLKFDPEAEARRLAAPNVIGQGESLARQGKVKEAIAAYGEAQRFDPSLAISATSWNYLCWYGALWGHAPEVLRACEQAVAAEPKDAEYKDSRGVARALVGDMKGAVDDFQAFIAWTKNEKQRSRRQSWVQAIREGKNPFTPDEIKYLLNE